MIKYNKLLKLLQDNNITSYTISKNKLMSQSTLNRIKNGTGGLDCNTLDKLCNYFNCQPSDLIEYVPDEDEKVS